MGAIAVISGRLGGDPKIRDVGDNKVCNFSVATNRRVKGEDVTDWHNVAAWNKTAELICKHMAKGEYHEFSGELTQNKYTDKNGNDRVQTELLVSNFKFGPNPKKDEEDEEKAPF